MSAENPAHDHDEPETPSWFTVLGIAIFLFGGIFALVASQEEPGETAVPGAEAPAAPANDAAAPDAPAPAAAAPTAAPAAADPSDPHAGHGH